MRNFGSKRTAIAEGNVQTVRLGTLSAVAANAASAHRAVLVSKNACRLSLQFHLGAFPRDANDNLVNSAGLTLMGYPDTSGAPSANLRR